MWFKNKTTNPPAPNQHGSSDSSTTAINLQGFGTPMPPRRRSRFLFGNNMNNSHRSHSHSNSNPWMTSSSPTTTTTKTTTAATTDRPPLSTRQHRSSSKHHHHHSKKGWKIFLWTIGGIMFFWMMMRRVSFFFSSSSHKDIHIIPATIHTQTVQQPYQVCHLDPPWGRRNPTSTTQGQPNHNKIPSSGAPCTGPPPLVYPLTTATHLTCPNSKTKDTTTLPHNHPKNNKIPPFDVAIAWTYYASPTSLLRQLDHYTRLFLSSQEQELEDDNKNNKWKERRIVFLVIDDGSPPGLQAADYVTAQHYQDLLPHYYLQLVQIDTNIAWNQPGARNLAMHVLGSSSKEEPDDASSSPPPPQGLVLSLDIDVWIPSLHDLERLLTKHEQLSSSSSSSSSSTTVSSTLGNDRVVVAHSFNRTRSTTIPAQDNNDGRLVTYYKEHPSALAMTALDWWQTTGGMDEDFAGHYGSEDVAFWWKFEQHTDDDSFPHPSSSSSSSLLPRRIRYHHEDIILQQLDTLNGGECDSQWIPSTTDNDLFSQCTRAHENLPSLSRDANLNILKGQKKRKTGCWSNTFLRFPWHFVDRVGVVAPSAT